MGPPMFSGGAGRYRCLNWCSRWNGGELSLPHSISELVSASDGNRGKATSIRSIHHRRGPQDDQGACAGDHRCGVWGLAARLPAPRQGRERARSGLPLGNRRHGPASSAGAYPAAVGPDQLEDRNIFRLPKHRPEFSVGQSEVEAMPEWAWSAVGLLATQDPLQDRGSSTAFLALLIRQSEPQDSTSSSQDPAGIPPGAAWPVSPCSSQNSPQQPSDSSSASSASLTHRG